MNIEFAKSLSGHDRNQIYLVKEKDEKFVYLVNGTTRQLASPKKKSVKHIQIIRELPGNVTAALESGLTDITIKRAVRLYQCKNEKNKEENPLSLQRQLHFPSENKEDL